MKNLKFKIGDNVDYCLTDKPLFSGVVIGISTNKTLKPYILLTDAGETKYAHENLLRLTKS